MTTYGVFPITQKDAKLHNYGLYQVTRHGKEVDFPIGYRSHKLISLYNQFNH